MAGSGARAPRHGGGDDGLDEIFHPEAARAREFVEIQHEMVVPQPGAGDQPWDDGWIVLDLPEDAER